MLLKLFALIKEMYQTLLYN